MTDVSLLEKTGSTGNAKPKAPDIATDRQASARDRRPAHASSSRLREFLAGLPVEQWFDPSAPAIRSGEIVPAELDETAALALLRDNPRLICQPLVEAGDVAQADVDAPRIADRLAPTDAPADLQASPQAPAEPLLYYVQTGNGSAFPCRFDPPASR